MSKTAVQRRECIGGFEDAFKTMAVFVRSCRNGDRLFQAAGPKKLFTELVSCRWLLVAVTVAGTETGTCTDVACCCDAVNEQPVSLAGLDVFTQKSTDLF